MRPAAARAAAACLIVSCGGDDLVLPSNSPSAVPAALEVVRGDEQPAAMTSRGLDQRLDERVLILFRVR